MVRTDLPDGLGLAAGLPNDTRRQGCEHLRAGVAMCRVAVVDEVAPLTDVGSPRSAAGEAASIEDWRRARCAPRVVPVYVQS